MIVILIGCIIMFLILFLMISLFTYNFKVVKKSILGICKYDTSYLPTINILTRTGNREKCYKQLVKTLNEQTYRNFVHYKICDNPENKYLENEDNVIYVDKIKKINKKHCPYNSYFNILTSQIEGWCILIDDDVEFINEDFLYELANICYQTNTNESILYPIFSGKSKSKSPASNIRYWPGSIDMANICIHTNLLNKYPFSEDCGGDFRLIDRLIKNNEIVNLYTDLPQGIWSNYKGHSDGKITECYIIKNDLI